MRYFHNGPLYILVFFTCMLSIVIFYLGLSQTHPAHAASRAEGMEKAFDNRKPLPAGSEHLVAPSASAAPAKHGQASGTDPSSPASTPSNVQEETAFAKGKPYKTTAYFLNVREQASSKSRILRTVEKGTMLNVLQKQDNGWLKLEDEGYVHGAYAKPADPEPLKPQVHIKSVPDSRLDVWADEVTASRIIEESGPLKPSSQVVSESGLTEEDISQIFEGTELLGHDLEEAVLEIEEQYGINAYFTIAVMKLESGNGKSRLARVKNNLFGLNATGGSNEQAYSFETKADSVRKFGSLISGKYVDQGYTTVEKVARKYCPANSKWPSLVKNIMNSDHRKV